MYGFNISLFLSLTTLICAEFSKEQRTILATQAKKINVNSLLKQVNPGEVLPIVLFLEDNHSELRIPRGLKKIVVQNGRMIFGTEFFAIPPKEQIFFCPNPQNEGRCLFPQDFEDSDVLQCAQEAIPLPGIEPHLYTCGLDGIGNTYQISYHMCFPPKPYTYSTFHLPLYDFCYIKNLEKIIFTMHTIFSPRLLDTELLSKEQHVEYEMSSESNVHINANYQRLQDVLANEEASLYKIQLLVPPEDMALGLWRKSTYHFINADLQHGALVGIWNEINQHIRNDAINAADFPRFVYTAVVDIPNKKILNPEQMDQQQIYNIWVKMVLNVYGNPYAQGMAILMNNFIAPKNTKSRLMTSIERAIEQYCNKDICTKSLKRKFAQVGGRVRCCVVTQKIRDIFGEDMEIGDVLLIRNINSSQ